MKKLFIFIILLINLSVYANWKAEYYKNIGLTNFRNHSELNKTINFSSIDYLALNAAIFFATNEVRKKHGLSYLDYHPLLEKAA